MFIQWDTYLYMYIHVCIHALYIAHKTEQPHISISENLLMIYMHVHSMCVWKSGHESQVIDCTIGYSRVPASDGHAILQKVQVFASSTVFGTCYKIFKGHCIHHNNIIHS